MRKRVVVRKLQSRSKPGPAGSRLCAGYSVPAPRLPHPLGQSPTLHWTLWLQPHSVLRKEVIQIFSFSSGAGKASSESPFSSFFLRPSFRLFFHCITAVCELMDPTGCEDERQDHPITCFPPPPKTRDILLIHIFLSLSRCVYIRFVPLMRTKHSSHLHSILMK